MSQKTYTVNRHRQLVDLNGDSKNFDLTFTCTSKDGAPFEILVVDQATLDSTPTLQYKKANGIISGNIVADKNVYQNYFLVLKADKPCQVTVKTIKKEIKPNLPDRTNTQAPRIQRPPSLKPLARPKKSNWKIIAIAVIVLGGGALLYYFYTQNKNNKKGSAIPAVTAPAPASVPSSPAPSVSALSPLTASDGLLSRLRSLDMSK